MDRRGMIAGKVSINPVKLPVVLIGRLAFTLYTSTLVYQSYGHNGTLPLRDCSACNHSPLRVRRTKEAVVVRGP